MKSLQIDENNNTNYIEKCKRTLSAFNKFIIWGTGQGAQKLIAFMELNNLLSGEVLFIDNNKLKTGQLFMERYMIFSPDYLNNYNSNNTLLIITCADCETVFEQAKQLFKGKILILDFAWMDFNNSFYDFYTLKKLEFEKSYNLLADELSQETFKCLINYKISRNPIWLKNISIDFKKRYFDENIVSFNDCETFIDCGAFIGETTVSFIKKVNNYNLIIAIEPDAYNYNKLLKVFNEKKIKKYITYNVALSDNNSYESFSSELCYSSNQKLNHDGKRSVKVCELDILLDKIHASFIKMDVEGSETKALIGAHKIIKRDRPKLAICAYHKWSDFFDIPILINSINDSYKIYMRHYSSGTEFETVIYAIN